MILGKSLLQIELSEIRVVLSTNADIGIPDHMWMLAYSIIIESSVTDGGQFGNQFVCEMLAVGYLNPNYNEANMQATTDRLYGWITKVFGSNLLQLTLVRVNGDIGYVDSSKRGDVI